MPPGKCKGKRSPASLYRALAEHAKRQAHSEAIEQAHTPNLPGEATTGSAPLADRIIAGQQYPSDFPEYYGDPLLGERQPGLLPPVSDSGHIS